MASITIDFLCEKPVFMPQLAAWLFAEWFSDMGFTQADTQRLLRERMNHDSVPLTLVAYRAAEPIGTCSLVFDTTPDDREEICCLAGVYVLPTLRQRGVGSLLCRRAIREAERLGLEGLFLYTPDRESFYRRMGWRKLQQATNELATGIQHVAYMQYPLAPLRC